MTVPEAFAVAVQHHRTGRLAEAQSIYRQILAAAPRHAESLHLLGVIAHQLEQNEIAVDLIRQAIALSPADADAHNNLGVALKEQGHFDDALAAFQHAIRLRPELPEAHDNRGNTLRAQGHHDDAICAYHTAIRLKPDYAEAHINLGAALTGLGRLKEAVAACRRAIQLKPDCADAYTNLGAALAELGRFDEAIAAYRAAIQLKPDDADVHNNLGVALKDQGHPDEAIAAFRRALQLKPDYAGAHGNLLLNLHYLPGIAPGEIFREHCRWDEAHARPLAGFIRPHGNDRNPERRLRVGYVSPDFREHSVAFFLEGLLAAHDPAQVEVFCYADLIREDRVTERFRRHAAQWRKLAGLGDEQTAELIRNDRIDILVDLAGHTAHNRLLVLARKPAPVQVTYLGYCDTTGMRAMDYRLTDAHADPPGTTEHLHAEELVRLPQSAWCFRPSEHSPPVEVPPVGRLGQITFGCFNALPKITEQMLGVWAQVLLQVPGSRLLLKSLGFTEPSGQVRTREFLEKAGLAAERVGFMGFVPTAQNHLVCYSRIDVALDTFPYHGTTTTCEALWMGVPVVTLAGKMHAGRVGVSLLANLGLQDCIASDEEDYVRIAADLAADTPRLSMLRATLREKMRISPLMDAPRFARNVEHAYRKIWRTWCASRPSPPPP